MKPLKLFLNPPLNGSSDNHGVGRVIAAQYKHLPNCGVEFTENLEKADVVASHITGNQFPRLDVLHVHGLYWTAEGQGDYGSLHHHTNAEIIESARRALQLTVPSEWVAMPFRRDMRIDPAVIGHGIDLEDWKPAKARMRYVLWNKTRIGDVCSPTPAYELAKRGIETVVCVPPADVPLPNKMQVIGILPHKEMRKWVRQAGIYLATTQETFGIGMLEAMAAGVPILGYAWGGALDIVQHGVTGYLAKPNDIEDLIQGYEWILSNWEKISACEIAMAQSYDWSVVMPKYVEVYRKAAEERKRENHRVTVVITNYNYAQYVGKAIDSVLSQTIPCDVVVVDDGSKDGSAKLLQTYADKADIILQDNAGVAAARNRGIAAAKTDYIISLDADDELDPRYAEVCKKALDADPGLGIAYPGLGFINDSGGVGESVWDAEFSFESQATPHVPPSTTIHCAAMFRKKLFERAGGYRQKFAPAEDAELWTRMTSLGARAQKVSKRPLLHYRNHPGSHSQSKPYHSLLPDYPWMKSKKFPMAAPANRIPLVQSYSHPVVSVIIPCSEMHHAIVADAIFSVLAQTISAWEIILIDDSHEGAAEALIKQSFPFVRYFRSNGRGAGAARNIGISHARAPLLFFLDADDLIEGATLETMLWQYSKGAAGYIYSGCTIIKIDGTSEEIGAPPYDQMLWTINGQHSVSVLIGTEDVNKIGGFDETMEGWEDWEFFVKCAIQGICGEPLPYPLLTYRHATGVRRETSLRVKEKLFKHLRDRYAAYATGEKPMAGCCGGNYNAIKAAQQAIQSNGVSAPQAPVPAGKIRMQFIGDARGAVGYQVNGRQYVGANMDEYRYVDALAEDVGRLEALGVWRRARVAAEVAA